jgi:thioredoxin-related protein
MRRNLLGLLAASLLLMQAASVHSAGPGQLKQALNLQRDGQLAARQGTPLLLMVSREECPFCEQMKKEILQPMELSGEYRDRVLIRELLVDDWRPVVNFQGHKQSAADLAAGYKAGLTPTLLFLDSEGKELTQRMIGINTIELFGLYLDTAIDAAQTQLLADR